MKKQSPLLKQHATTAADTAHVQQDPHISASAHSTSNQADPLHNFQQRPRLTRLADFIYEAGMLRKTPRSGYQFLGSGHENVAEHSYRTSVIGCVLASMANANVEKTVMMCLFHDFHEARTGDMNYVNKMYNSTQGKRALEHATHHTGLEDLILPLWEEEETGTSLEALLARDADQLDMIANLLEQQAHGNPYAAAWIEAALKRLRTNEAKQLAEALQQTDQTDWWFKGPDSSWWEKKQS